MAIINCPECRTEVSDKARNCPKCAFPINNKINKPQTKVKNKEGCFLQTLNIGCVVIMVIIAIVIFAIMQS